MPREVLGQGVRSGVAVSDCPLGVSLHDVGLLLWTVISLWLVLLSPQYPALAKWPAHNGCSSVLVLAEYLFLCHFFIHRCSSLGFSILGLNPNYMAQGE